MHASFWSFDSAPAFRNAWRALAPLVFGACAVLFPAAPSRADEEEAGEADLEREVADLKRRLRALEEDAARSRAGAEPSAGPAAGAPPAEEPAGRPGPLRGVYDKPFLGEFWRRAHVGGYTELEYHDFEDGILGVPEGFRMHRTNLFFFTEVSDTVRFGSEIEFETEFEGGDPENDIEVAVEMAFVDWTLFEELTFRGGVILAPLGRINVNHDGPVRELTERPMVSTFVIPTTLSEPGVGIHGGFRRWAPLTLRYEAYAVNGFNLLDRDGELAVDIDERELLLREGRNAIGGDINGGVASTGRLGVELVDRLEAGGSWHAGTYDERGDNVLVIVAGDLAAVQSLGWAELALEGEIAAADFQRDDFARSAGVPDQYWGYYAQAALGGMPPFLRDLPWISHVFDDPGARWTMVFRYERVDLEGDVGEALEPGINFRPVADTVFKFSYRLTQKSLGDRGLPGRRDWDDDGFVFSIASYF
jgi:hypothetical protein